MHIHNAYIETRVLIEHIAQVVCEQDASTLDTGSLLNIPRAQKGSPHRWQVACMVNCSLSYIS